MIDLSAPRRRRRFQEWIVAQRWFGSKARDVAHIDVAECIPLREEVPQLALALVEARFGEGTHETYQVPLGLRPAEEGWDERVIGEAGGWTIYDALADPATGRELLHRMRSGSRGDRRGGHAALPLGRLGGRRAGRDRRRAAGRRRAVQLLDRLRRGADPEGLPARGAGREPRARAAALPVRARVPEHRRRWPAGTSSRAASSTRRWGSCRSTWRARATAGSWRSRRSARIPDGLPGAPARARRGDRRAAHRAGLGQRQPRLRARRAVAGGAVAADRRRRRADRADLPRPAGDRRDRRRSRAAARTCARSCRRCRTSAPAAA